MSKMGDFAIWRMKLGTSLEEPITEAEVAAYKASRCSRCHARDVELRGGICGNCGDDLRQDAQADEAGA